MNLPDGNALDFMEAMKKQASYAEWLFLTGYGSVPDSVMALRLGAYDFLAHRLVADRQHHSFKVDILKLEVAGFVETQA